jgi:hypothetical protein
MKQSLVFGLVVLALAIAVWLHAQKIKDIREEPDAIAYGLLGIEKYLDAGQPLKLRLAGVNGEVFFYARLALAPRNVTLIREHDAADTFLLISGKRTVDSSTRNARVIWQYADTAYHYQLLSAK